MVVTPCPLPRSHCTPSLQAQERRRQDEEVCAGGVQGRRPLQGMHGYLRSLVPSTHFVVLAFRPPHPRGPPLSASLHRSRRRPWPRPRRRPPRPSSRGPSLRSRRRRRATGRRWRRWCVAGIDLFVDVIRRSIDRNPPPPSSIALGYTHKRNHPRWRRPRKWRASASSPRPARCWRGSVRPHVNIFTCSTRHLTTASDPLYGSMTIRGGAPRQGAVLGRAGAAGGGGGGGRGGEGLEPRRRLARGAWACSWMWM